MEETISLKELFQTLKKRLSLIVVITALAVMASGIISFFVITPIYQLLLAFLVSQVMRWWNITQVRFKTPAIN